MELHIPSIPKRGSLVPPCEPNLKVILLRSTEDCDTVFKEDAVAKESLVGFDIEWKPPQHGGSAGRVSVMQIATTKKVYVIQLLVTKEIPSTVRQLLQSESPAKVAVGIKNDALKLQQDWNIECKGCINVQRVFRDIGPVVPGTSTKNYSSLATMAKFLLEIEIDKTLARSDWATESLTNEQVVYAATDAALSRQILVALASEASWSTSSEFLQNWKESIAYKRALSSDKGSSKSPARCEQCSPKKPCVPCTKQKNTEVENASESHKLREAYKVKRFESYAKKASRKSNLYDNIRLEAPDGQLLAMIPRKKLEWYKSRELGEVIEVAGSNPVVRLKFEPRGRTHVEEEYYLSGKVNQCVACGTGVNLLRHYIVPHEYRQYFPQQFKIRSSHDIVLLCVECNAKVSPFQARLRKRLNLEYKVKNIPKFIRDDQKERCGKCAFALIKSYKKIPKDRRAHLWSQVKALVTQNIDTLDEEPWNSTNVANTVQTLDDIFSSEGDTEPIELTDHCVELLKAVTSQNTLSPNPSYVASSFQVVQGLLDSATKLQAVDTKEPACNAPGVNEDNTERIQQSIQLFVEKWRSTFVECLKPQFMPQGWNVNFKVESNTKHSRDTYQVKV